MGTANAAVPRVLVAAALAAVVVLLAIAGGCGSDEPPEPAIPADVNAVRTAAARAMGEVDTVHFTIARTGAAVSIDESGLVFERARGRFAAPSSADALITARAGDATVEVGAVAISGTTWITNPVTGRWEVAPEGLSFDPATLFDPDVGWRPLLATGLRRPELVAPAPDGEGRYQLQGVAEKERISILTGGLVDQSVPIDLWIDSVTGRVVEARFDAAAPDGTSSWRMTLSEYGSEVVVERPSLGAAP